MRGAENGLSDMESDNLKGKTSEMRNWEREGKRRKRNGAKKGKGTRRHAFCTQFITNTIRGGRYCDWRSPEGTAAAAGAAMKM